MQNMLQACGCSALPLDTEFRPPPRFDATEAATSSCSRFEELISMELEEAQRALASSHRNILRLITNSGEVTQHMLKKLTQRNAETVSLSGKTAESDDLWLSFNVPQEEWKMSEPHSLEFERHMSSEYWKNVALCKQLPVMTSASDARPDGLLSFGPKVRAFHEQGECFGVIPAESPATRGDPEPATSGRERTSVSSSCCNGSDKDRYTQPSDVQEKCHHDPARNSLLSMSSVSYASSEKKSSVTSALLPHELSSDVDDKEDEKTSQASGASNVSRFEHADADIHEVAQVWTQSKASARLKKGSSSNRLKHQHTESIMLQHRSSLESEGGGRGIRCRLLYPHSTQRLLWDLLSFIIVCYDLIFIPLQFFDPPQWLFLHVMSWITRLFWTLDVVVSFSSGFVRHDGAVEMLFRKIARRYCETWFALDVSLVLVDWSEVFVNNAGQDKYQDDVSGVMRLGKASRVFRMLRMIRLLRLARITIIFQHIVERLQSERLIIAAGIIKIVIGMAAVAHLVACSWYGLSVAQRDRLAWIYADGYDDKALGYRYATSLHWSLSQFAGGMDEVRPHCVEERIFAICAFLMSFVMAAVAISAMTSSMTQLHIIGSKQSQQLSVLRRYLAQNGISNTLSVRVQRNVKHAFMEQHRFMSESSVELLALLSEPLRAELDFETYSPILRHHSFFSKYIDECPQVMRKVCHLAVSLSLLSQGDIIFSAGEVPAQPKMYIVCAGVLSYSSMSGSSRLLSQGSCIAEATLWTEWCHRGVLSAVSECRLLMLDAQSFQTIATRFEHHGADPATYARDFVERLNTPGSDADDIVVPETRLRKSHQQRKSSSFGPRGPQGPHFSLASSIVHRTSFTSKGRS